MYGLSYLYYFFRAIWRVEFFTALLAFHALSFQPSALLPPTSNLRHPLSIFPRPSSFSLSPFTFDLFSLSFIMPSPIFSQIFKN
jgi:hypothetical protein